MGLIPDEADVPMDKLDMKMVDSLSKDDSYDINQNDDLDMDAEPSSYPQSTLEQQIEQAKQGWTIMLSNDFRKVQEFLDSQTNTSGYHAVGMAAYSTVLGVMMKDMSHIKKAVRASVITVKLASILRKKRQTRSFVFATSVNSYTDEQCHGELLTCWGLAMQAASSALFHARSLPTLVKSAVQAKVAHNVAQECKRIADNKTNWTSDVLRRNFEAAVHFTVAVSNLGVSYAPKLLCRLLELIGVSGDRMMALDRLRQGSMDTETVVFPAIALMLVVHYAAAEQYLALGEPDAKLINRLHGHFVRVAPNNGLAVHIGHGFNAQLDGQFDKALGHYDAFIKAQELRFIHYLAVWQKLWVHAAKMDWVSATNEARILMKECPWSPTLFHYLFVSFAQLCNESGTKVVEEDEFEAILVKLVTLKKNFGGRIAFHENLVVAKTKMYNQDISLMVLPALDMMYVFNTFGIAACDPERLPALVAMIEARLSSHPKDMDIEIYCYLTFMKAVCHNRQKASILAEKYLLEILACEKQLLKTDYKYLCPQSCLEMAFLCRAIGDKAQAKSWLKKTKRYSGYLTESLVLYRVEMLTLEIKGNKKKRTNSDGFILDDD